MFDSPDFDLAPYAGIDADRFVRRTFCSWEEAGWRSVLVQGFVHAPEAEALPLPGTRDLHLVLCTGGDAVMRTRDGGRTTRRRWVPGRLELIPPGRPTLRGYRAAAPLRSVQVHLPRAAVERTAAELGGPAPDFEALAAAVGTGDPLVEQVVRALAASPDGSDLYAESAAAFLLTHLLTRGRARPLPGPEHAAVRAAVALMRERLADPLTVADLAAEARLSTYHFIRVFREATGETPHRYLARLRIAEARRLLTGTGEPLDRIAARCGFSGAGSLSAAFLKHVGVRPSAYRRM
ncbi:helix-turn-helix transcriptional regulator [Streptomyces sp. ISL-12]|uniref:AraC family transcriptional regulator n=1 Tax=Streptomyces sp. ISL-12 TaxID=2819177 RepID=UPI001BEB5693|nr:AraC family transcriptional regulator [Streptomyces sp. ISL-12]MBT2412344.1 helix-turn-helix transcriptional regulator [Streptomyces sp. ISL-12]